MKVPVVAVAFAAGGMNEELELELAMETLLITKLVPSALHPPLTISEGSAKLLSLFNALAFETRAYLFVPVALAVTRLYLELPFE